MIYGNIILEAKNLKKKEILELYFLEEYDAKDDDRYNKRCDKWDNSKKLTSINPAAYDIKTLSEFYYMEYTENDIINIIKKQKISKYLYIMDNNGKEVINPQFDGKKLGIVFGNGGGDFIIYCIETKKFYIYLHEESSPILSKMSMSFKEFMSYCKSECFQNPIYKERYKNK